VPVVGPGGKVSGVLSIDDVLDHVVGQLSDVSGSMRNELTIERTLET
jgi:CBS domain-containing protein